VPVRANSRFRRPRPVLLPPPHHAGDTLPPGQHDGRPDHREPTYGACQGRQSSWLGDRPDLREDVGISGAKGRDQRPAFNQMLKDAMRRRFDVLMVWSIDRLGRSVLHVASAMAEMDAAGVALYSDQQAIDSTSPFGKAMMQMACVFGELEREMIRARVVAGLNRVPEQGIKKLGRPQVGRKIEEVIRRQLGAGHGILKVARMVGCGSGTVQRVKKEIAVVLSEAALLSP
jgi:DNA invertase Pin-like site-specific DNA recombinase